MQFFLAQVCRCEAHRSEDGSSKEKIVSANVCVRLRLIKKISANTRLIILKPVVGQIQPGDGLAVADVTCQNHLHSLLQLYRMHF